MRMDGMYYGTFVSQKPQHFYACVVSVVLFNLFKMRHRNIVIRIESKWESNYHFINKKHK